MLWLILGLRLHLCVQLVQWHGRWWEWCWMLNVESGLLKVIHGLLGWLLYLLMSLRLISSLVIFII